MSKLLFITQKIDENDDDLAFVTQWIDEFIKQGIEVSVICLTKGQFDGRFLVYSLGKESGKNLWQRIFIFWRLIFSLEYDRVFVHMNPEYFTLGGLWWWLASKPAYLWYTHYTDHIHLRLAALFSKRMFAATTQSLPQYNHSPKKTILSHGIDVDYWGRPNQCLDDKNLLMIHRLSRSKQIEIGIGALARLPADYTLTIYGRPIDAVYYNELKQLVIDLALEKRVIFRGPLPMPALRNIYPQYKLMINMAVETIDKTMLEAMCSGVFPVTTPNNARAIGLPAAPASETAESLADFILSNQTKLYSQAELVTIVSTNHSLSRLVSRMKDYIEKGI